MTSPKETFNNYLFTVDRLRRKGASRPQAHWQSLSIHWHEMADRVKDTKRDPLLMGNGEIDAWLGWLVGEWNRVSR